MQRIALRLQNQGLSVWIDNEKLIPGTPVWEAELEKAIKTAGAVVVVMSPASKQSDWVRREITLAEQYHKRIFPVLADGDEESAISIRLITKQFVDIRKNEPAGLDALSINLQSYLVGNHAPAVFSYQAIEKQPSGVQKIMRSWLGRLLIGVLVGLVAGQIMAIIPDGYFGTSATFISALAAVGGFAGLLMPSNRVSLIIVTFGFIAAGLIFGLIDFEVFDANYFIGIGIFIGAPLAALFARVLYWRKVIQ